VRKLAKGAAVVGAGSILAKILYDISELLDRLPPEIE
jgi:hypothetical protein